MQPTPMTRRAVLGATAGLVGALAGCLGAGEAPASEGASGPQTVASFFLLEDVAAAVGGDVTTTESLVPVGQHGHGWEPTPRLQSTVLDADLFLTVMPGFQPWVDAVVANAATDGSTVHIVDASSGLDLEGETVDGHEHEHESEHEHGGAGEGHEDEHAGDADEQDHHNEHDEHDHHDGHDEVAGADGGHRGDAHDHGVNPHFWLNPRYTATAVGTIADGFVAVDPANEATYRANAAAYRARLAALDERFEAELSDRTRETVLFAGHAAFGHLADRYGFTVETVLDLSPDDTPSPADIVRARDIVEASDIDYILTPVFGSDRAARTLVEETGATDVLPLTPLPGLTREWQSRGWGYIEVMESVNLPTLRRALGVDAT